MEWKLCKARNCYNGHGGENVNLQKDNKNPKKMSIEQARLECEQHGHAGFTSEPGAGRVWFLRRIVDPHKFTVGPKYDVHWLKPVEHSHSLAPGGAGGGGAASGHSAEGSIVFYEWNVYWMNKDFSGIAKVIAQKQPDIIGLAEFMTKFHNTGGNTRTLVDQLNRCCPGRNYQVQDGTTRHGKAVGYGTDIFYDANKFVCLESGKRKVRVPGTMGGARAANYAVLREKASGKVLITGGIHTSANLQPKTKAELLHIQQSELKEFYSVIEDFRRRHSAPVMWMGDLNTSLHGQIIQDCLRGRVGHQHVFPVEDIARTHGPTFYSHARTRGPIDFILGEAGKFRRIDGGRAGPGKKGHKLAGGADHFPIFAEVTWA